MFDDFRDRYLEIANSSAYLNEKMNRGMFLSLAGSLVDKRGITVQVINKLDPRVHSLLIQPSRSGKGAAIGVAQMFSKFLGLSYVQELQITDAAMVGKIDQRIHQRNKDKGYRPGDPNFVDPLILGDFGLYDVVTFPEAKMMFKVGTHTEDKLEIFQTVMDSPGWVRKKLADDVPIQYPTHSTIIGTTYFLDEFEEILLKQGMFQRLLVFIDPFGIEKRKELNEGLIEKPPELLDYSQIEPKLRELAKDIVKQVMKVPKGTVVTKDKSAIKALKSLNKDRMAYVSSYFQGRDLEIMLPYTTAIINMHHKLACIAAVLNGSSVITRKEVLDTNQEIQMYFNCVVNDIITRVSGVNTEKVRNIIKSMLQKEPKGLSKTEIKEKMDSKYHVNSRQTGHVIKDMIKNKELNTRNKQSIVVLNRR